jgi:hypothetical protein
VVVRIRRALIRLTWASPAGVAAPSPPILMRRRGGGSDAPRTAHSTADPGGPGLPIRGCREQRYAAVRAEIVTRRSCSGTGAEAASAVATRVVTSESTCESG